jgi:hypothetical protein
MIRRRNQEVGAVGLWSRTQAPSKKKIRLDPSGEPTKDERKLVAYIQLLGETVGVDDRDFLLRQVKDTFHLDDARAAVYVDGTIEVLRRRR